MNSRAKNFWFGFLGVMLLAACAHEKTKQWIKPQPVAFSDQQKELQKDRSFAQKQYRLGMERFQRGKHEEALRYFRQALPHSEHFALPHYGEGLVYLKIQDFKAASLAFALAISIKPDFYQAYHGIARAQRMLGDFRGAERSYRAALKYAQREQVVDPDLYLNLGILYEVYLGKKKSALKQYRQYVRSGGEHTQMVQSWIQTLGP